MEKQKANDIQVAGNHYRELQYQPWDFAHECKLPFTISLCVRYLCRWRTKNGIVDLEKAAHCLTKSLELRESDKSKRKGLLKLTYWQKDVFKLDSKWTHYNWIEFTGQLEKPEQHIMEQIRIGNFRVAISSIQTLIRIEKHKGEVK